MVSKHLYKYIDDEDRCRRLDVRADETQQEAHHQVGLGETRAA